MQRLLTQLCCLAVLGAGLTLQRVQAAYSADVRTTPAATGTGTAIRLYESAGLEPVPLGTHLWFVADTAGDGVPTNPIEGEILGPDDVVIATDRVDGSLAGNQTGRFARTIRIEDNSITNANVFVYLWRTAANDFVQPVGGNTFGLYQIGKVAPPAVGNAQWRIFTDVLADQYSVRPAGSGDAPTITAEPQPTVAGEGASATFAVEVKGSVPMTFQWYRSGALLTGRTERTITITNVSQGDAGSYTVLVVNRFGVAASEPASLKVQLAPIVTDQPRDLAVIAGETATFNAGFVGGLPATFEWVNQATAAVAGRAQTLFLTNVTVADSAGYALVIANAYGRATTSVARLTVNSPPFFTQNPVDQIVGLGKTATFSGVVGGTPPVSLRWIKDGNTIAGATNASLSVSNITLADEGAFALVATSTYGRATSAVARLIVSLPPVFITQPVDQSVEVGSTAQFDVVVDGANPFSFRWRKGGVPVATGTNQVLALPNVSFADAGGYSLVVSNVFGSATSVVARLSVRPAAGQNTVIVSNPEITGDVTWRATNIYVLTNYVYVLSNAVLRLEPGTVVKGRNGAAPNFGSLFVCQGGRLLAEGTVDRPIIFTAEEDDLSDPDDLLPTDRGLWGGLVILGKARINKAVNAAGDAAVPKYELYEGLEDRKLRDQFVHRFGGNDDDDSSGVLRYVSIRHGGQKLSPDKEINGLSLGGVGRGTVIDFVEVVSFADDGFEFFGGSVNTRHLISAFNDDDSFDTDMGYNGRNQFWFAIQSNDRRDNGSEQNGEPNERNDGTGIPKASYEIFNATLIGAGASAGGTANNNGMLLRRYVQAAWHNGIFTDFNGQPLNGGGPQTGAAPRLTENLWWGFTLPVFTNEIFTAAGNNNSTNVDPLLRGISRSPDGKLDPRPMPGSPALTTALQPPADGFYTPAPYKGAFSSRQNWMRTWSFLGQAGFFPESDGPGNLYEVLVADPNFSTLVAAVDTAGLAEALKGPGPFTLFAPSNAAFDALGSQVVGALLADPEVLSGILQYHALSGARKSPDLVSGNYATLQGDSVTIVNTAGALSVNGAPVTAADAEASNGILHTLGQVLMPPAPAPIVTAATAGPAGLTLTWTGGEGPFTVQSKSGFQDSEWTDVATVDQRTLTIPAQASSAFFRVVARVRFGVGLKGAHELPPVASAGTGSGTLVLDGGKLTLKITYSGLSGPLTMAHIHGPADTTSNAGVLVGLVPGLGIPGASAGTIEGSVQLNASVVAAMLSGNTYVNLHSTAFGAGELRGQVVVLP